MKPRSAGHLYVGGLEVKPWLLFRVALLCAGFAQGLFAENIAPPPEDVPSPILLAVFLFGVIGALFVIGVQAANPISAKVWRFPDWESNPFSIREPLLFFHFGGWYFLSIGFGILLRHSIYLSHLGPDSVFILVFASGLLIGVRSCTLVYRRKMTRDPQPINPPDAAR